MASKNKPSTLHTNTIPVRNSTLRTERPKSRVSPIQNHRFKVGQILFFVPGTFESTTGKGTYSVVSLLPADGGDHQYRVKSKADGHERVVREGQLSMA